MTFTAGDAAPWCVAVPVRTSRFQALDPKHASLNVEVDLAALTPFGYASAGGPAEALLHCDLQTSAGFNYGVVLGSGRSGFYRGRYLKGVGRTTLAGHWNRAGAAYHASGHLTASGAVRELVTSRHLAAAGYGGSIVPCEGLLLAPLHPDLTGVMDAAFPADDPAPVDRHLQALSVKPGDFARASNLVWLLDRPWFQGYVATFFGALGYYLTRGDESARSFRALGPEDLAAALARAIGRALAHFEAYLRAGVFWGSFHNNCTLDGRFLDLECATLFGGPFVGVLRDPARGPSSDVLAGPEALSYLREMRLTLRHVRTRLRFFVDEGLVRHPVERAFVETFLAALAAQITPDHPVASRERACACVTAMLERVLDVPAHHASQLRAMVHAYHDWLEGRPGIPSAGLPLRPLALELSRSEGARRLRAHEWVLCPAGRRDRAQLIHEGLEEVDAQATVDGAFAALERLLRAMRPCGARDQAT